MFIGFLTAQHFTCYRNIKLKGPYYSKIIFFIIRQQLELFKLLWTFYQHQLAKLMMPKLHELVFWISNNLSKAMNQSWSSQTTISNFSSKISNVQRRVVWIYTIREIKYIQSYLYVLSLSGHEYNSTNSITRNIRTDIKANQHTHSP